MLFNQTSYIDFCKGLMDEYNDNISIGKKPSQIKVRIDFVLKRLIKIYGAVIPGLSTDTIIDLSDPEDDK